MSHHPVDDLLCLLQMLRSSVDEHLPLSWFPFNVRLRLITKKIAILGCHQNRDKSRLDIHGHTDADRLSRNWLVAWSRLCEGLSLCGLLSLAVMIENEWSILLWRLSRKCQCFYWRICKVACPLPRRGTRSGAGGAGSLLILILLLRRRRSLFLSRRRTSSLRCISAFRWRPLFLLPTSRWISTPVSWRRAPSFLSPGWLLFTLGRWTGLPKILV
mmetsp:Transcript_20348/g.36359  ORF Transcript_20348/g.36359 Transcript_20348/m.36359 type:complete len:215 (-) Transcript_20348:370-1014(-)